MTDSQLAEIVLKRETPPVYGKKAIEKVSNSTILVTGAGGSIGSEIVRQILRINPKANIHLLDNNEYAIYRLQLDLTSKPLLTDPKYILADITDRLAINSIFRRINPDIVFHAAAYKHLPILERHPEAAIRNNTLGTEIIAENAAEFGVKNMVNISTDKAAHPVCIMGMSKRLAEMRSSSYSNKNTTISSVRFGNVLGSRGSFFETLRYQIEKGHEVTITDPQMSRFFMTIPEAAGLVIESAAIAHKNKTYILDMGPSIKIVDLVKRYCELTKTDPKIIYTGMREGEKMQEELHDKDDINHPTSHPRIFSIDIDPDVMSFEQSTKLYDLVESGAAATVLIEELKRLVAFSNQKPNSKNTSTQNYVYA